MGNYQQLVFYQKARQVVKNIDELVKSWPKTMQAQEISRQLFRLALPSTQILRKDMEDIRARNMFTI